MSEITKLYKNAGIEPTHYDACTVEDKYWQNEELANEYGTFDMYMNAKCGHQEDCTTLCSCAYTKEEYPPFTPEKQLELIKWLTNKFSFFAIEFNFQQWSSSNGLISGFYQNSLEESIADYINSLWQSLTEEEKQQVKGILE